MGDSTFPAVLAKLAQELLDWLATTPGLDLGSAETAVLTGNLPWAASRLGSA